MKTFIYMKRETQNRAIVAAEEEEEEKEKEEEEKTLYMNIFMST